MSNLVSLVYLDRETQGAMENGTSFIDDLVFDATMTDLLSKSFLSVTSPAVFECLFYPW